MNIKSIMLGTAAGLMAVSGAYAADLPGEQPPAAVDYVKVCDAFGAGFFYIPGTDTCLDISGRVRFRVTYNSDDDNFVGGDDSVQFRADGRVDFDARTATEYGQLRSFFRIGADGSSGNIDDTGRGAEIENAFIQLGYLTVGLAGDLFNGDVLYGINDAGLGFDDNLQITVLADDLGGGFYVGASINAQKDEDLRVTGNDIDNTYEFQAAVGIAQQPWGGVDLSFVYAPRTNDDFFGVKGTADLSVMEGFGARLTAGYFDQNNSLIELGAAVSYAFTPAATVYGGVRYDFVENLPNNIFANVGVDYTVTPGLILTGELSYSDTTFDDDEFQAIVQLTRNW